MPENLLILGGAGFLGSHLVSEFAGKYHVYVLEKQDCHLSRIENYLENIELHYAEKTVIHQFLSQNPMDFIINCSVSYGLSESLEDLEENNVTMPLNWIESCGNRTKAFINTDTFFNKPENHSYSYLGGYIQTKKQLEEKLKYGKKGLKIINLKLEHLYGPGDSKSKFIPSMISRLLANEKEIKMTPGNQVRDFIYVKDVAKAYSVILENIDEIKDGFTGISAGTGKGTSIRELSRHMKELIKSSSDIQFGALPYRDHEIMHSSGDPAFLTALGWKIKYDLSEGLRETIHSIS